MIELMDMAILGSILDYVAAHPLQVLGTMVGIVYLVTEIRASKWLWLWSIVMPVINLFVYYQKGLYADFGIDIYYVVIAIYGFCAWKWGGARKERSADRNVPEEACCKIDGADDLNKVQAQNKTGGDTATGANGAASGELPITRTPAKAWPILAASFVVLFFVIRWVLVTFTDSTVPNSDSFTTALSIVAMVMLSRKWIEQWWAWAIVDAACVALYLYKDLYGYAALYTAYTVLAFYGYRRWTAKL